MDDWTNNDAYRAIPQMEHGNPVQNKESEVAENTTKAKHDTNNMFAQSIFDLTLITINICQICYILKVGPELGILYYIMLGLLGISLILLSIHGFMGLFGRLRCSTPLSDSCFNCLYNTSLFMVVLVYLVNLVFSVLSLKETEETCQIVINNMRNRTAT
ncbi:AAEL010799-PB [Aedes aegypti]|uniref:AAEL010799-PB n=2 Tax=Aedes aegypti TaxID=7159 RepID=A0A1S4FRF5_AEDAE|nr:uncharacterized protein LOC5573878 isoform X2 [Aedes aegypti]EJY57882.1 AAEL010799-PB [Aedes aegypti]